MVVPPTAANDLFIPSFQPNPQTEFLMERMVQQYADEYLDVADEMKVCSQLRYRDLLQETVDEFCRMENFCRIFPTRNSKMYDKFFSGQKLINKILYRVFYTSEILAYGGKKSQQSPHQMSATQGSAKANSLIPQT